MNMKRLLILLFLSIFVGQSSFADGEKVYIVKADKLNLRVRPQTGDVRFQVFKGDTVYVTDVESVGNGERWCWVGWSPNHKTKRGNNHPHGWAKEKYLKNITSNYSQRTLTKAFYPSLYKAKQHFLWTMIAFVVSFVLFFIFILLSNEIGSNFMFNLGSFLFHFMPIASPCILCQYFYFNPNKSFWFVLNANGYGWIGFILWLIVSFVAIVLIFNSLKQFFTDWSWPSFNLCYIVGAGCWVYYFYLCLPQFYNQASDTFLGLLLLFGLAALPGVGGGASMPAPGSLVDGSGRTVATGNFHGDNFYDGNGNRYSRKYDGSWEKN